MTLSRISSQTIHNAMRKSYRTMNNVIREAIPNDAYFYQGNQTKRCIMLSRKSNQTMYKVINVIKTNDA